MKNWTKKWQLLALSAGFGSVGAGCDDGTNVKNPPGVVSQALLVGFSGENACSDLEQYLEDTAVMQMRTQLESTRDGVPQWGWWGWFGGREVAAEAGVPTADASKTSAAPRDYTTTNTQVAGVDEADFVKNDGTRIFALSGDSLYAAKSWPAEETAIAGKLKIEGWPREMFLDGSNRLVVFSSLYRAYPMSHAMGVACDAISCGYYNSNTVKVSVIDVTDMAAMKVTQEYVIPGTYNSSRKVGASVRAVLSDNFNFPDGVKWYPDYKPGLWENKSALREAYNAIIAENEKLIRGMTIEQWISPATAKVNGETKALPHACESFARVNAPTRLGTVSVATLNLENNTLSRTTIISEPGEIYASQKNLYVATRHWWWWPAIGQSDTTYVHKFDISSPDAALYTASGVLPGYIVDQFSMDESESGHFRVVTTLNTRVPDTANPSNTWGRNETFNRLTVFEQKGGILEAVGRSEDLAKGERVMSSRILGNRAFVVTFRQVDPLFTFDLTDPANPKKMGELKIPGFSTYMHPIDENHLLTIGTFVPEAEPGQPTSWNEQKLQLAIFDVSDLSNPKQTAVQLVGTAYSWSEAVYDHKAFNYFAAKKLLAIPFSDWNSGYSGDSYWSSFVSDLRVYSIDPVTGITPKGTLSMSDVYKEERWYNWSYYWTPAVRRSVMADDYVYAISDAAIRVANVADLTKPLATARFNRVIE